MGDQKFTFNEARERVPVGAPPVEPQRRGGVRYAGGRRRADAPVLPEPGEAADLPEAIRTALAELTALRDQLDARQAADATKAELLAARELAVTLAEHRLCEDRAKAAKIIAEADAALNGDAGAHMRRMAELEQAERRHAARLAEIAAAEEKLKGHRKRLEQDRAAYDRLRIADAAARAERSRALRERERAAG